MAARGRRRYAGARLTLVVFDAATGFRRAKCSPPRPLLPKCRRPFAVAEFAVSSLIAVSDFRDEADSLTLMAAIGFQPHLRFIALSSPLTPCRGYLPVYFLFTRHATRRHHCLSCPADDRSCRLPHYRRRRRCHCPREHISAMTATHAPAPDVGNGADSSREPHDAPPVTYHSEEGARD